MTRPRRRQTGEQARRPAKRGRRAGVSGQEANRLLHELEVHQAELEIQNEELRRARLETEAALLRYTELFEAAPIGYATLSFDGKICDMNHMGLRLLDKAPAALIGRTLTELLLAEDMHSLTAVLEEACEKEGPSTCEVRLDGEQVRCLRVTASAVGEGRPTLLLAFEDITERRLREDQLERTQQALRDGERRKNEFLAALSHELRNPLAPIRNCLFLLPRVPPDGEQARKAYAIIDRQVTHLSRLVDDLLDVTRITRGKIQLQTTYLDFAELVRKTVEDHRAAFEAQGIALLTEIGDASFRVRADETRLVQALSNLLANAEKFTSRGGTVRVSLQADRDKVVLAVNDDGIGISPEVVGHLFEPFAQAPQSMDRARGGLGLGLAMVKGLIDLHGGKVDIESAGLGRGTTVILTLPLAEPSQGAPDIAAPS